MAKCLIKQRNNFTLATPVIHNLHDFRLYHFQTSLFAPPSNCGSKEKGEPKINSRRGSIDVVQAASLRDEHPEVRASGFPG
jgi:hypothetical protein